MGGRVDRGSTAWDADDVSEHATYVIDVRRERRAGRERMVWRTAVVLAAVLAAGPAWDAVGGHLPWATAQPAAPTTGATPPADGAPVALEPGDPAPQEPTGTGDTEHLRPAMRRALRRAQAAAAADGIDLRVTSGWRSRAKQEQLFEEAVAKYGSRAKAHRWVLLPDESEHVQGGAIDVGPRPAAAWLEQHGVRYGLCRRYANEPWHFELLAPHKGQACPAMEAHA